MTVANTWLLTVSLLAVAVIAGSYLLDRRRVTFSGVLRFLAAASVVASFGGIRLELERAAPLSVYVLDISDSYEAQRLGAVGAIREHAAGMPAGSQGALVVFGASAALQEPVLASRFTLVVEVGAGLGSSATNLEEGLKAASSLGSQSDRIYLFSDGRANSGSTDSGALLCSQAGMKVCPVILGGAFPDDAWVGQLNAPAALPRGEPARILIPIASNRAGRLEVSLSLRGLTSADGSSRLTRVVESPGSGVSEHVEFVLPFEEPGIKHLRAYVRPIDFSDAYPANNAVRGAINVLGPPKLRVYSASGASAAGILLERTARYTVEMGKPDRVPGTPGALQDAAAVVLDNVSAAMLTPTQMNALKRYVRDLGGGLIVLGGPNSFGPGGYIKTELEKALPLWCNPEKRKSASLVFVLDASGSMNDPTDFLGERIKKFQAALKAVLPVYRELKKGDMVAIVTFNTQPTVELPLTADNDGGVLRKTLTGDLSGKEPTGKTNIYPALRKALKLLEAESPGERRERVRHIVLLSDGRQTVEDSMGLGQFKEAGVSVSAVATGTEPDRERLKKIADTTGGRYYEVARFDPRLRDIFVKELRELSRLKRTGVIKVKKTARAEFLRTIGEFPALGGIVLTRAKDGAHVVAQTDDREPVLAWWRLGLGKSVAFTGALNTEWGKELLTWDQLGGLFSRIVRWAAADRLNPDFTLSAAVDGRTVRAKLQVHNSRAPADSRNLRAVFSSFSPDSETPFHTELAQAGPWEYEAQFDAKPDSLCVITAYQRPNSRLAVTEVWVPGSLEVGPAYPDSHVLSRIASQTRGTVLDEESFLSDVPEGRGGRGYDLWWVLLVLAGCFFIADIAQASLLSAHKLR